MYVGEFQI